MTSPTNKCFYKHFNVHMFKKLSNLSLIHCIGRLIYEFPKCIWQCDCFGLLSVSIICINILLKVGFGPTLKFINFWSFFRSQCGNSHVKYGEKNTFHIISSQMHMKMRKLKMANI